MVELLSVKMVCEWQRAVFCHVRDRYGFHGNPSFPRREAISRLLLPAYFKACPNHWTCL